MPGRRFPLEVQARIPAPLLNLQHLAANLVYSWDRRVRDLFAQLDAALWQACGYNPKRFLRHIAQQRLDTAATDAEFIARLNTLVASCATHPQHAQRAAGRSAYVGQRDLIAYACAEYGLHESLPIYSGGLGILAGDYCKAMSDLGTPFVAVGILYRLGYFKQTIDADGNQIAGYTPSRFEDLPISCARGESGEPLLVAVRIADREVLLQVWLTQVGNIELYLQDADLAQNTPEDRAITYQLYGGREVTRIQQEIVLGIGGVRALRALGLTPRIWHINEGHAAFQILERCRELVGQGLDFASALEAVAANTVFTTHTPVAAGHDVFDQDLVRHYLADQIAALNVPAEELLALGASPAGDHRFNMTALALRGSGFHNGVSAIHGGVAAQSESYIWPQIEAAENPIGHVTNGIHVATFLTREWETCFDQRFGRGWRQELSNGDYWRQIDDIPAAEFWQRREQLKTQLIEVLASRVTRQMARNGESPSHIKRALRGLRDARRPMLLGFARRFATYKRATLIFADPARLARVLNDPAHPVVLVFAGKAHPEDRPGQELIRAIHQYSRQTEFEGKVLLVEDYDIALARKLVAGVDVWLNTPRYPLEASGTSGQKAAINGVLNLSVLDGWWAEGYSGDNGWGISPQGPEFAPDRGDREDAWELLDILEREVVPLYFARDHQGLSPAWIARAKAAMRTIIPQFNAERMAADYRRDLYTPAGVQGERLADNNWTGARELAAWKRKIVACWPAVNLARLDLPSTCLTAGASLPIRVAVDLGALSPADVVVECVLGTESLDSEFHPGSRHELHHCGGAPDGRALFSIDLKPGVCGLLLYQLRVYPHHRLLAHPFEMGRMLWV